MLLSPKAIKALNSRCVVYTVNVFPREPAAQARVDSLRAWAARKAPQLSPLLDDKVDIGPYLLGPDGQVAAKIDRADAVIPTITRTARKLGVQEKPPVVKTAAPWFDSYEPGDLALKLTSRFLEVHEGEFQLPAPPPWQPPMLATVGTGDSNRRMYEARLKSPTREGIILKEKQVEGLFPAGTDKEWDVPRGLAVDLLWLFRPSTHQFRLEESDVREVSLRARAGEREGDRLRVHLEGRVSITQWWYPRSGEGLWLGDRLAKEFWAETPVWGYADLDLAKRKVLALRLVSDGGVYRGIDGTLLPYETVLYSVSEAEAEASCPPPATPGG